MKPLNQSAKLSYLAVALSLLCVSCQKDMRPSAGVENSPGSISQQGLIFPILIGWVRQADLPFGDLTPGDVPLGRYKMQSFAIGGKGYFCGGEASSTIWQTPIQEMKDLWEYDTLTHAWTQKAGFPGPLVDDATSFVVGNKAYIVVNDETWQYDQATDTWTAKAKVPTRPRQDAISFAINGKGYLGFGQVPNTTYEYYGDFWEYDPVADTWTQKASFKAGKRAYAAAFALSGKGYVCSGERLGAGGPPILNDLWEYDPVANVWTAKADFPGPPRVAGIGLGGDALGRGYVLTGITNSPYLNDCWQYNPGTNTWAQFFSIGTQAEQQRGFAGGFVIGTHLYMGGGVGPIGSVGYHGYMDFWRL